MSDPTHEHPAVDKVVLLMVSGMGQADLVTACLAKLDVASGDVATVLSQARRKLTRAADYNRDEQLGTAVTRLNDIYARSIRAQDVKTALVAQKEINKLMDLYRGQPVELEPESLSAEEVATIRQHLLAMTGGAPDASLAELARLACTKHANLMAQVAREARTSR